MIARIIRRVSIALMVVSAAGAGWGQSIPVDGYAAIVNKRVITVSDVLGALGPMEAQLRSRYTGQELNRRLEQAYQDVLDALIERTLILEEFKQNEGKIPAALVDDHMQEVIAERFDNNRAAFIRALAEEGITLEDYREGIRDSLVIMLLQREMVFSQIAVSPGAVRDAYKSRLDQLRKPEQIHLRMIVLNRGATEEEDRAIIQKAESAREELLKGHDFGELARAISEGSRAADGGDWGWVEPDILRRELAQGVKGLKPGQISDVLETQEAYYILLLADRREESIVSFEEVQEQLYAELRFAEEERLHTAWINRLKDKFFVQRFFPVHEQQQL